MLCLVTVGGDGRQDTGGLTDALPGDSVLVVGNGVEGCSSGLVPNLCSGIAKRSAKKSTRLGCFFSELAGEVCSYRSTIQ
ncbi:hypothetical protein EMIT0232MI5_10551 [Pseudomonas sp. IT-232MI5]